MPFQQPFDFYLTSYFLPNLHVGGRAYKNIFLNYKYNIDYYILGILLRTRTNIYVRVTLQTINYKDLDYKYFD